MGTWRILDQEQCIINTRFDGNDTWKIYFHKNMSNFFSWCLVVHFGITLLVDVTPHTNIVDLFCNAIFLEPWDMFNTYDNYLLRTFLPYLEYLDSSKLNDFNFVKSIFLNIIRCPNCYKPFYIKLYHNHTPRCDLSLYSWAFHSWRCKDKLNICNVISLWYIQFLLHGSSSLKIDNVNVFGVLLLS